MSKNKREPMTAREFVLDSNRCPACRSVHIDWGSHMVEGNSTYQEARCMDCETGFSTVSRLVGYLVHGADEPQTIAEDFAEVTSAAEPVDVVHDELLHADRIIRKLVRLLRRYARGVELPPVRQKERSKFLTKGRPSTLPTEPVATDPLVIEVRGGGVEVHKPKTLPGLRVVIRDYDVDGVDETVLTKDDDGDECQELTL